MKKPLDSNHFGGIDLHTHSTASDGTWSSSEIMQHAAETGIRAISITDHDTLEGSRGANECALSNRVHLLTGVEISTKYPEACPSSGSLHILAYGVDIDNAPLQQALEELQEARDMRLPKIIERLNRAGIPIHMEQVLELVGTGSPGRPHIGRLLIEMGVVSDIDAAFDQYLAKGRPAYVDKYRIDCRKALELIRQAGGIPVLAHPYLLPGGKTGDLSGLLKKLCDFGLMGIEAYYSDHPPEATALYLDLARRLDLLVTGGSDFHGELNPDIQLGRGRGDLFVPFEVYEALAAKLASRIKDGR